MKHYISLIRVRQWYKNLVVFLAIFFSGNLFNFPLLYSSLIAFCSLCLVSSANYVLNDLIDMKKDRLHPEKRFRPLASGKISKMCAIILALTLFVCGVYLASTLSLLFLYMVIILFLINQLYSLTLKKIVLADVLTIATLFVVRAIAGAFSINVTISPWLILGPFFLALFLAVGKRHADLSLLQEKARMTRKVLQDYNQNLTNSLMGISTTLLIISYALYSFLSEFNSLLFTLPFALFVIFRFYQLITSGSVIARNPEKVIKDKKMLIGMVLWFVLTAVLVYIL